MSVQAPIRLTRQQVMAYRLRVNGLTARLPADSYAQAARFALQDTYPRSALLSLHAQVEACAPNAWAHDSLVQTYSPRAAVHVLPRADLGVFTLGRLPDDPAKRAPIDQAAERVCQALAGQDLRATVLPDEICGLLRQAAASGRIALRWTTSALYVREISPPGDDPHQAGRQLCRLHLTAFGPSTPDAFAWWAGVTVAQARRTWREFATELTEVDFDGVPAWLLADDLAELRRHDADEPPRGVRLLPAEEAKLFGRDRTHRFAGPAPVSELAPPDRFRPHLLLIDGHIAGRWGRRGRRISVISDRHLTPPERRQIEQEAASMPLTGGRASVSIADH